MDGKKINNLNFNIKIEVRNIVERPVGIRHPKFKYTCDVYVMYAGKMKKLYVHGQITAKSPADLKREIADRIIQAIKDKGIKQYYL